MNWLNLPENIFTQTFTVSSAICSCYCSHQEMVKTERDNWENIIVQLIIQRFFNFVLFQLTIFFFTRCLFMTGSWTGRAKVQWDEGDAVQWLLEAWNFGSSMVKAEPSRLLLWNQESQWKAEPVLLNGVFIFL